MADIPKERWKAHREAQCQRLGLRERFQVVTTNDHHQYQLGCDLEPTDDAPAFREAIIIGQWPRREMTEVTGPRNRINGKRARQPTPEDRKPVSKRVIDLSDQEIAQVLELWALRKSALDLPFIVPGTGRKR